MPQLDFNVWFINGIFMIIFFFFSYLLMYRYMIFPLIRLFYTRCFIINKTKKAANYRRIEIKLILNKNLLGFKVLKKLIKLKNLSEILIKFKNYQYNYYLLTQIELNIVKNNFLNYLLSYEIYGKIKIKLLNEIFK